MRRLDALDTSFEKRTIAQQGQARTEYDIYSALASRLGFQEHFTEGRTEMDWLRYLYNGARQQAAQQHINMPEFDAF